MEFNEKLKALREAKGYTQEDIAGKLNIARQSVSKWEQGINEPDVETLKRLAEIFECSVDELLSEEEMKQIEPNEAPQHNDAPVPTLQEKGKPQKVSELVGSILLGVGVIAFILTGIFWTHDNMGWKFGWTFILDAFWISSLVPCIMKKRINQFLVPIFVASLYCKLGILGSEYGFNGWGVFWVLFILIPAFYLIATPIDKYIHKEN